MGGSSKSSPPAPQIIYSPAPPPPPPPAPVYTQAVQTQTGLNEVSGAQSRLNMELGAQLDRSNAEFFTGQDIRRGQSESAEQRLTIGKQGEEQRASTVAQGEQERLGYQTQGTEQRETVGKTAEEERTTNLQQEMFRRYKENRDYEQAQQQYRA